MSEPTTFEEWWGSLKQPYLPGYRLPCEHAFQAGQRAAAQEIEGHERLYVATTWPLQRRTRGERDDAKAEIERLKAQLRTSSVHDELAQLTAELAKLPAVVEKAKVVIARVEDLEMSNQEAEEFGIDELREAVDGLD